jgi:type I restriction enzyme M protein
MVKKPNTNVSNHEIFIEYQKKLRYKNENEFFETLLDLEKEKLLYFILTCSQKLVIIKTGNKDEEKKFLGYEFSNRR